MKRILVIGELCIDKYVYGEVNRLSPEAPIPVINPLYSVMSDGMAGNVVNNVRFLSPNDKVTHWYQDTQIVKTRYVHKKSNQMLLRVDEGEMSKINEIGELTEDMVNEILDSDLVLISDYNKGFLSEEDINKISSLARLCILDTKKKINQISLENITFIKLNEVEYKNNQELVDNHREKFVITMGEEGAMYMDHLYPSLHPQETIDVSGAGDTFISAFGLMFLKTNNIHISIDFANEVCADVVNKKGVSLPNEKFIKELN
jgi:bifunctional ADP-heptose synthase (sugar kinase/adenylyltransferase)